MRVTSPPAASLIAAALAVLTLLAHPSSAGAERWQRPVPGEVTRSFHYSPATPFAAGAHRGADLAAVPGDTVRAACAGVVVHAGPIPGGGRAVTLGCGDRRVTHLPLRRTVVRPGANVGAGARIGTLAPGHGGLHLGVRAAADPFGYVDPLGFLPATTRPAPPPTPVARPARRPAAPSRRPIRAPIPHPSMPAFVEPARRTAPALVWAGLALAALATAGTGALITRRRARATRAWITRGSSTSPAAAATPRRTP
ncbi:MAG: M23 family metallopeptidase [Solirubrobacteraceae bacterium]